MINHSPNTSLRIFRPYLLSILFLLIFSCKKDNEQLQQPVAKLSYVSATVDGSAGSSNTFKGVSVNPLIKVLFTEKLDNSTVSNSITLTANGLKVPFTATLESDSILLIKPFAELEAFTTYTITVTSVRSLGGAVLQNPVALKLSTSYSPVDKFPLVSDEQLLDIVQKQTFKYFWDFGHPVSGLARERDTSGDLVTSGGSGFGIMAIIVGAHRQFVTRAEALARMQKIVGFLKTRAQRFHGAYPHWLSGSTGTVIPFSAKDNGADLVETAFLMQGLLTARQYFDSSDPNESALRADINLLWDAVEWSWFRKNGENVLYWHWSPSFNWDMNHKIEGWNEALITYVLAASSNTSATPKIVYDSGWARNGSMRNGSVYFGQQLPLGPPSGGPLFFSHYSFLGINPKGLTDTYANYETQTLSHTLINYNYCRGNPKGYIGYSEVCWGLTASDDINGYRVHEPTSDNGVISPTAALSSFPYTPDQSMAALKFFYYKLGDKIFKEYGFTDAFSLTEPWFATSTLAIDQGPTLIMIENHRSGLLWNLFMSSPEVKKGMKELGFNSPKL